MRGGFISIGDPVRCIYVCIRKLVHFNYPREEKFAQSLTGKEGRKKTPTSDAQIPMDPHSS